MSTIRRAGVSIGVLMAIPAAGFASTPSPSSKISTPIPVSQTTAAVATHATKGVVKSINSTRLVIARSPKAGAEMVFVLTPSTEQRGEVGIGSTVEVRYRTEAKQRIATVVSIQERKHQPVAKSPFL